MILFDLEFLSCWVDDGKMDMSGYKLLDLNNVSSLNEVDDCEIQVTCDLNWLMYLN